MPELLARQGVTLSTINCAAKKLCVCAFSQSYSKRIANAKSDKYHSNVHKRGKVWEGKEVRWLRIVLPFAA